MNQTSKFFKTVLTYALNVQFCLLIKDLHPISVIRCFSEVSHPQQYSIATRDIVVPMNTEVPMEYPLSHKARIVVLEIRLYSESQMLYRPALHGN